MSERNACHHASEPEIQIQFRRPEKDLFTNFLIENDFPKRREMRLSCIVVTQTDSDSHVLNQYGQMQSASPTDNESIGRFAVFHLHGEVSLELTIQSVA